MTFDHTPHVDALANYVFETGYVRFREMNAFLEHRGVPVGGDQELTGNHLRQPQVASATRLLGEVSEEYVRTVAALFTRWPVSLMIGDPASFKRDEEPWWVTWTGRPNLLRDGFVMVRRPPVNTDVHDIADSAKYAYAVGTQKLAESQYRLAELAGTGKLDPDVSMSLQENMLRIWEALYGGTVCAVRDWNTSDWDWDETDNTYSDGRRVITQARIERREDSDDSWEHNGFMLGDGAPNEFPLGTISYIAPVHLPEPQKKSADGPTLAERMSRHREDEGSD